MACSLYGCRPEVDSIYLTHSTRTTSRNAKGIILMNAAVIESFDRAPRYATFGEPEPQGELLIQVRASALRAVFEHVARLLHRLC
jgi:hypothetical protein